MLSNKGQGKRMSGKERSMRKVGKTKKMFEETNESCCKEGEARLGDSIDN